MDFTKPITYNGFTFQPPTPSAGTPLSGAQIRSIQLSNVDALGYLDKKALDDGMDATDVFLGARTVLIDAAVYGSTQGDMWDTVGDLMSAFDPVVAYNANTAARGFIPLTFYRPTADIVSWPTSVAAYTDGIPLHMNLRPVRLPTWGASTGNTGGQADLGGAIPVSIAMIARDPRIYHTAQVSLTVTTASQTATHRGGHPSWPFLTLTVSGGSGPSAVRVATDGYSVRVNLSTLTTGTFSLNYATRHITDSNGSSRDDLFDTSTTQEFAPVQPGGSVVNGYSLTNVTIGYAWREAWP